MNNYKKIIVHGVYLTLLLSQNMLISAHTTPTPDSLDPFGWSEGDIKKLGKSFPGKIFTLNDKRITSTTLESRERKETVTYICSSSNYLKKLEVAILIERSFDKNGKLVYQTAPYVDKRGAQTSYTAVGKCFVAGTACMTAGVLIAWAWIGSQLAKTGPIGEKSVNPSDATINSSTTEAVQ